MKVDRFVAVIVCLLLPIAACAQDVSLTVNAQDNIYGAGAQSAPGGGNLPVGIAVSDGETLFFTVTGSISLNMGTGNNFNNADGVGAAAGSSSNTGYGSISGISGPNAGYLVGVFVPAGGPSGTAPMPLNFTLPGSTAFASLAPQLDQVFFIGDGLTGDGTGTVQTFHAPAGATVLYLGISDAGAYNGPPSWYNDNEGTFHIKVIKVSPFWNAIHSILASL